LGWLYSVLASFWLHLFQRDAIKHYERVKSGYRIGLWKVYWRLPPRVAIAIALLSAAPILAAILFEGWPVILVTVVMTGVTIFLWLFAPPGHVIGFTGKDLDTSSPKLIPRAHSDLQLSIQRLVVFGIVPALGIGALLSWIVTRFAS
jgi:hypothetical protein